jgi:hypothetical protein
MTVKYGTISKDKTLLIAAEQSDIYTKEKDVIITKTPDGFKPIEFAPIPEFDQERQAVYQDAPVDKDDYIKCGVKVIDLPEEKEPIEEPILTK